MAVTVTVVTNPSDTQTVVNAATVVEIPRSTSLLSPGNSGPATEVVKPGGTVANVAWGPVLPEVVVEGQIFILTQDPVVPSKTFVGDENPGLTEPGLWWETDDNGDITLWIEDGE